MVRAWLPRGVVLVCFSFSLCTPALVHGQVTTGSISGTVKDTSGSVLPGATVVATNIDTNFSRSEITNERGEYSLLLLPVGTYRIEAELSGFRRFVQTGIVIELSRAARVDPVLAVGGTTENVEVVADAPLVDTSHVALGRTVNQTEILNLPIVDRDVYALLDLTAGIDSSTTSNAFGIPGQETLVNGSANTGAGSVNYSLDGGANMSGLRQTGNIVPNPDAVQEFRVQTNSYSAEHGRFGGAVVDVITKSGSNSLSGSLFDFFRDDSMNADRWTVGESSLRKDLFERNNVGGTVGGPIFHDRTFFFASYNGIRQTTSAYEASATVPTPLERQGDFSQSFDGGRLAVITDPLTGRPFPGNRIPSNRFDPVAVRIMDEWIPLPNLPGRGYEVEAPIPLNRDEFSLKIDHNLAKTHRLTGSYFLATGSDHDPLNGNLLWTDRLFEWDQHNVNLSDTWTMGSSMVNELHFTFVHNVGGRVNTPQVSIADYGSAFVMQGAPALPLIDVSGYFQFDTPIAGTRAGGNTYQLRDVLTLDKGKHSFRFGGTFLRESMAHFTTLDNYGEFQFEGDVTGDGFADFLLGVPDRIDQDAPIDKFDNGTYLSAFFQDDYRLLSNLTLNLGVRYDLQFPLSDPQNRKLTYVPGQHSAVVPGALPGMLFPGDTGPDGTIPNTIASTDYNNIGPRLGFAWDVAGDGKTAVRGAFGIFYGTIGGNQWNATADNQPFAIRQDWRSGTLSNPYLEFDEPPFPYVYDPQNIRFILPASVAGIALDYDIPYTYQFNAAVQRQLTSDLSATIAYVGARGRNLPFNRELNYPVPGPGSANNRRPILPGTLGSIQVLDTFLTNEYNGLQLTIDKRLSRHFQANAAYTFGKSLEDAPLQDDTGGSVQNQNDILADRGRTENDRRHQYKMSVIWRTDYFNDANPVLRALLHDWTISGIVKLRSGRPLTITAGRDANGDGVNNDRANLVAGVDPTLDPDRSRNEVIQAWFNTQAFAEPAALTNGSAPRNFIDGPGSKLVDIGIFRDFALGGGRKLQIRMEATNAFNFVNLDNPTTNVRSSDFGLIDEAGAMRRIQLGARFSF
ncbi:MAG: carboxypeptidase regulatory-like domain-containing protein [Vicinamibacterales bacterium]